MSEKQMASLNPKLFCKAWFAVREFMDKNKGEKFSSLAVSFDEGVMEISCSDGNSLAICQIEAEASIEGTILLSLAGNAYDEFNKFVEAVHIGSRQKEGHALNNLLIFEVTKKVVNISIIEPTLFDAEPSLQIHIKVMENEENISYKRLIRDAVEVMVGNTFGIDLGILNKVERAIFRLSKQSVVKVMQSGDSYVMVPYKKTDKIDVYYIAMGVKRTGIAVSDFQFQSVQSN